MSGAADFVREHLLIIVLVGSVLLVLGIAIGALVSWLNSRGKFMLMDNVVRNKAEVKAPWGEWAAEANAFFVFRFAIQLGFGLVALMVVVGAGVLAWPAISANSFNTMALAAVLLVVSFFLTFGIAFAVFILILQDFVVPIMFLRRMRPVEALAVFRNEMLPGNYLTIVLYYLIKIGLSIGAALLAMIATCLTCCMTAVPYIGAVILLPITVYFECYKLHFIEQFGPQWKVFPDSPETLEAGPDDPWGAPGDTEWSDA